MAQWTHLYPYRTQKLSTVAAMVASSFEGKSSKLPGFFLWGIIDIDGSICYDFYIKIFV